MVDTSWLPLSFPSRTAALSIHHVKVVFPGYPCSSNGMLHLKDGRYNCQKCGCSGDTKEANYRYRLSLEVADTHDVFGVTVFGSCLDAYFGVTAKGLQRCVIMRIHTPLLWLIDYRESLFNNRWFSDRLKVQLQLALNERYIEELNREAGEDKNDAVLGVVFRAVETCFTGKKFVFRIKSSDKPSVASLLQNGCQTERGTKTVIACEMFVPHPGLVGYTVIHYMEQQRCSQFKQRPGALGLPDHVTASDHPSRELKSLHLFEDWDATQSHHGNDFSTFWPDSFGLSLSSASSENTERSAALVSRQATSEQQKCQSGSVTSARRLVYNLRGQKLMPEKGYAEDDKKSCSYLSPPSVTTQVESGSESSMRREGGDPLESPLALEQKDSSCKISIQSSYGLTYPQPPWPHQRPKGRLASPSSPDATGGVTAQEASSEGFTEFLAKLDIPSCAADLPNGQKWRPASGLGEKSSEDKQNRLLAEEQDNSLRAREVYCSPLVGSSCPKANFDASADLFDVSARGSTKTTSAKLPGPQTIAPWAGALTPNCITSEFRARQGKVNSSWSNSNYGSSFHDAVGVSAPRTSTPIAGSFFKSECSLGGTLDFTPDSHSLPLARPYHPDRLLAGKGSILSHLPPSKLPQDKAKCKRSRLPFKNTLVKQLISKFSMFTRSSNAEASTVNPCGPPELFTSRLLARELLSEGDGQEWSPPSEKIQDRDVKLRRRRRRRRRRKLVKIHSHSQVTEDSPLFVKQGGSASPSRLSRLAKVRLLPNKQLPEVAGIEGQPARQQTRMLSPPVTESLGKPSSVDLSRSKLFPRPSPVPHVADWSSELFPDQDHLPNTEATVSQPTC